MGADHAAAETVLLGPDIASGQRPQFVVPPGHWQRARPQSGAGEATGTAQAEPTWSAAIVVPGFDFADFALGAG